MRTLTSTFDTRAEAELARERLQLIGVPAERISLRELPAGAGGTTPGGSGTATGAAVAMTTLLSVKVAPDQVEAASGILKGLQVPGAEPRPDLIAATMPSAAPAAAAERPAVQEGFIAADTIRFDDTIERDTPAGPGLRRDPAPRPAPSVRTVEPPMITRGAASIGAAAAASNAARPDLTRWGRYLVYYGLVLLVALVAGAALGLVT